MEAHLSLLASLITQELSVFQQPPLSTILILLLSVAISLVTTLANRVMMNMEEYKKTTIESQYVRQELMAAMKSKNQRAIAKAQKQQQEMMKNQQKMMMGRMKTTLIFFIPFILIWQVLISFFKGVSAYAPIEIPMMGSELSFGSWYILSSIATNTVISRIFGLTFEIEPKPASG